MLTLGADLEWQRVKPLPPCRAEDPDLFFPDDSVKCAASEKLKEICAGCPLQLDCRNWAIEHDEHGVWGGLSDWERKQMKRIVHRVHCPACRGTDVVQIGRAEICLSCSTSWFI